jgi:hypothetical protein
MAVKFRVVVTRLVAFQKVLVIQNDGDEDEAHDEALFATEDVSVDTMANEWLVAEVTDLGARVELLEENKQ